MNAKSTCLAIVAVVLLGAGVYGFTMTARPEPQAATGASSKTTTPSAQKAPAAAPSASGPHVTLSFNFTRANHRASNQYAAWIENDQGQLVKQLVVTQFANSEKAAQRPECLPTWTSRIKAKADANAIDAATSATPANGQQTYTWDIADMTGKAVPNGTYTLYLTATQDKGQQFEWSGTMTVQQGQPTILAPLAPVSTLPTISETPIIQDPTLS